MAIQLPVQTTKKQERSKCKQVVVKRAVKQKSKAKATTSRKQTNE